ncbi:hypothetical protein FH972_014851 [Carpinus fangiana]|uniref:EGF-like calcium-binding domain-containing protein n=1 Tax=Carpinus fangiana TaxID=176857 RepID=A0A5N6RE71_9ROSI|nr:hypothetical protein FH972_014851 [Carpinus fangiana]
MATLTKGLVGIQLPDCDTRPFSIFIVYTPRSIETRFKVRVIEETQTLDLFSMARGTPNSHIQIKGAVYDSHKQYYMSDINECESLKSPCFNGSGSVYCENTKGSYLCHSRVVEYPTKPSVRVAIIAIGISSGLGVLILLCGGWWSYKVEGKKEEIIAVANLAKRCLDLNGKKRPTMKEVAMELETIQMLQKAHNFEQNYEELEYV